MQNGRKPWSDSVFLRHCWKHCKTPTERLVAAILVSYRNHETGHAWPSQSTIATEAGFQRQTINQTLRALVVLGLIIPVGKTPKGVTIYDFEDGPAEPTLNNGTCQPSRHVNGKRVILDDRRCHPVGQGVSATMTGGVSLDDTNDLIKDQKETPTEREGGNPPTGGCISNTGNPNPPEGNAQSEHTLSEERIGLMVKAIEHTCGTRTSETRANAIKLLQEGVEPDNVNVARELEQLTWMTSPPTERQLLQYVPALLKGPTNQWPGRRRGRKMAAAPAQYLVYDPNMKCGFGFGEEDNTPDNSTKRITSKIDQVIAKNKADAEESLAKLRAKVAAMDADLRTIVEAEWEQLPEAVRDERMQQFVSGPRWMGEYAKSMTIRELVSRRRGPTHDLAAKYLANVDAKAEADQRQYRYTPKHGEVDISKHDPAKLLADLENEEQRRAGAGESSPTQSKGQDQPSRDGRT